MLPFLTTLPANPISNVLRVKISCPHVSAVLFQVVTNPTFNININININNKQKQQAILLNSSNNSFLVETNTLTKRQPTKKLLQEKDQKWRKQRTKEVKRKKKGGVYKLSSLSAIVIAANIDVKVVRRVKKRKQKKQRRSRKRRREKVNRCP